MRLNGACAPTYPNNWRADRREEKNREMNYNANGFVWLSFGFDSCMIRASSSITFRPISFAMLWRLISRTYLLDRPVALSVEEFKPNVFTSIHSIIVIIAWDYCSTVFFSHCFHTLSLTAAVVACFFLRILFLLLQLNGVAVVPIHHKYTGLHWRWWIAEWHYHYNENHELPGNILHSSNSWNCHSIGH